MANESNEGADIRYDLDLTFREAAAGLETTLHYPRVVRCKWCAGSGVSISGSSITIIVCPTCHGAGTTSRTEEIKVQIPAGVASGGSLRFAGLGNESAVGGAGDLFVVTHVAADEKFERRGDNVYTSARLTTLQLTAGSVVSVETLTDGVKMLRVPPGTKAGSLLRIRGFGLPDITSGKRGDLLVQVTLDEAADAEHPAPPAEVAAAGADVKHDARASRADEARGLRVFLCHSSGDKPAVRALYHRLRADGITPWLDEEDLLPGEKWEKEIPKAVRSCDIVIVCLSQGSLNKRGYLQKEIRYALDAAEEQPDGTIFLIPLKLEECEIPEHLSGWQWVNFFEERGYEKLMRALRKRAGSL